MEIIVVGTNEGLLDAMYEFLNPILPEEIYIHYELYEGTKESKEYIETEIEATMLEQQESLLFLLPDLCNMGEIEAIESLCETEEKKQKAHQALEEGAPDHLYQSFLKKLPESKRKELEKRTMLFLYRADERGMEALNETFPNSPKAGFYPLAVCPFRGREDELVPNRLYYQEPSILIRTKLAGMVLALIKMYSKETPGIKLK